MKKSKKVSIITVCFNSEDTISDTIESVNSQTFQDLEHIFIDGKSTDSTLKIIKKESKRDKLIISEKDSGLYDAMNKGIGYSKGEIIFILNSDDIFYDNHVVEDVVNSFKDDIDIVYGNIIFFEKKDSHINFSRKWIVNELKTDFLNGWHPAHPGFVVKKRVYLKHGVFDTKLKIASDFELMLRFLQIFNCKSTYLNRFIVGQRLGGLSTNLDGIAKGYQEIKYSFQKHNLKINLFYFIRRYIQKILQNI